MAYVYIYYDPRKTPVEPIYVGKGKGRRIIFHKTRAKNPILKRKLDKIKLLDLEPIIEKHSDNLSEEDALRLEIELIKKYGRIDLGTGTLCNLTDGGETTLGWKPSADTKKLWSEQRKGKKQTEAQYKANCERKVSEERKKYLSETMKGIDRLNDEQREVIRLKNLGSTRSDDTKNKMSKQRKGKKQTEAQYRANCNRKPKTKKIICINNNIIYESAKDAAFNLGLEKSSVVSVANGSRNHHKNYKFKYVD